MNMQGWCLELNTVPLEGLSRAAWRSAVLRFATPYSLKGAAMAVMVLAITRVRYGEVRRVCLSAASCKQNTFDNDYRLDSNNTVFNCE
jgi:hypothetical protein